MQPQAILDIVILIYFAPALPLAIYVGLKHGFARSAGWFNLNLLSLFRLVGSALSLAAIYQKPTNEGVLIASLIFSSMGTVSLLGALLGLIGRANEGLRERAMPPRIIRLTHLLTIAAIVLAIVGGNFVYTSNPSTGHSLSQAAIVILCVVYVVAVGICVQTLTLRHLVPQNDKRLLLVAVIALPFVLVRLILALISVFDWSSSDFGIISFTSTAVVIRALMGSLMEFIVVALFLWAGLTVDRSVARDAERAEKYASHGQYQGQNGIVQGPVVSSAHK